MSPPKYGSGIVRSARTWLARLFLYKGKTENLGSWPTLEEAQIARDRAILYFHDKRELALPHLSIPLGPASPEELARIAKERSTTLRRRSNPSGYPGVSKGSNSTFLASIRVGAELLKVGRWLAAREAAIARDRTILHFGLAEPLSVPEVSNRLGPASPDELRAEALRRGRETTRSGFRGVRRSEDGRGWTGVFRGRLVGLFSDIEDAATAYDRVALHHGIDRSRLNFPKLELPPATVEETRAWAKQVAGRHAQEAGPGALLPYQRGRRKYSGPNGVRPLVDGRFRADLLIDKRNITLGKWPTQEAASLAYDRAVLYFDLTRALNSPADARCLGPLSPADIRRQADRLRDERKPRYSIYRGVTFAAKRWVAVFQHKHLGRFACEIEAAEAWDRAARAALGSDAVLNFPTPGKTADSTRSKAKRRPRR